MSSEERKKILQMVSDGKITAEEAVVLMHALDEPAEDELEKLEAGSMNEIIVNLYS
jgi:polyhydroxyalkanoate synthesis regulator phasin